jgi:hypothetical protein
LVNTCYLPDTSQGTNEIIVFWKDDGHYDGIAIDEFPQMDGEFHPCTPSYDTPSSSLSTAFLFSISCP